MVGFRVIAGQNGPCMILACFCLDFDVRTPLL